MKVLIPTGGFFPFQNYGGPAVSILNICSLLGNEIQFVLLCPNHEMNSSETKMELVNGWNEKYNCFTYYLSEAEMNYSNFNSIVNREKPDWVYLNSLFDAKNTISFLKIAKERNIKVLLAPRGQLNAGAFKKKYKKIPYIWYLKYCVGFGNVLFQSTCKEETVAIKRYLCSDVDKIRFLTNVPSIPNRPFERSKETGKINIVFFGRIHPKKNLLFALEVVNCITSGYIAFDIYGPIEDEDYWHKCNQAIERLPNNVTVEYKGIIIHEKIFEVVSKYDLFFFPTLSENYGHVIAESLGAGVPVLISDQTPWSDVNEYGAGGAFPLSNKEPFVEFVKKYMMESGKQLYSDNSVALFRKHSNVDELKILYKQVFYE